jgi:hypothetical protein
VLPAKPGVAHALGISPKVTGLNANLFDDFGIGCVYGGKGGDKFFDFSLVQEASLMFLHQGFLLDGDMGVQLAR